jgi:hypothetical protein
MIPVLFKATGAGCTRSRRSGPWPGSRPMLPFVLLKNDDCAILEVELARVREGDPNEKCSRCCGSTIRRWTGSRSPRDRTCKPAAWLVQS